MKKKNICITLKTPLHYKSNYPHCIFYVPLNISSIAYVRGVTNNLYFIDISI